jgi:hypothetical protein
MINKAANKSIKRFNVYASLIIDLNVKFEG